MKKSLVYFITSRGIFSLAGELINIFGVLYLFKVSGGSAVLSLGAFAMIYYIYGIFFYPVIGIIERIGVKYAMIVGSALLLLGNMSILLVSVNLVFVMGWVLLAGVGKIFYYMSFYYYSEMLIEEKKVGERIGFLNLVTITLSMFIPLIGGFVTEYYGIVGLTIVSTFLLVISVVPLLALPNYKFEISRKLSDMMIIPEIRKSIKLNFFNELQSKEKFWELYIFIFFAESYNSMGLFLTMITLLTIPLTFLFGKYLDHHNRRGVLKTGSFFASLIWFGRTFSTTLTQFALVDIFHKLNATLRNQVIDTLNNCYLMKGEGRALLDEKIAIKEITQNFFIATNLIFGLILLQLFGFPTVFIFAAISSLLIYLL
jgi:MFS family permease